MVKKNLNLSTSKLPTETVAKVLADLVEKQLTHEEIANKYHISSDTVTNYAKLHAEIIGNTKKEIVEKVLEDSSVRVQKLAKGLLKVAEECLSELSLKKKLKKLNSVQLATVMAIVIDKRQLLTGGATEISEVKFTSKNDILKELTDNKNGTSSKNIKMVEKSMSFESANFKKRTDIFINSISVSENDIKNTLQNEGNL